LSVHTVPWFPTERPPPATRAGKQPWAGPRPRGHPVPRVHPGVLSACVCVCVCVVGLSVVSGGVVNEDNSSVGKSVSDQGDQGKPGKPGHRSIGRGSCRSARADGVEHRSTAVVRGRSPAPDGGPGATPPGDSTPAPPPSASSVGVSDQ
jgi:hypothetical protein